MVSPCDVLPTGKRKGNHRRSCQGRGTLVESPAAPHGDLVLWPPRLRDRRVPSSHQRPFYPGRYNGRTGGRGQPPRRTPQHPARPYTPERKPASGQCHLLLPVSLPGGRNEASWLIKSQASPTPSMSKSRERAGASVEPPTCPSHCPARSPEVGPRSGFLESWSSDQMGQASGPVRTLSSEPTATWG